MTEWRWGLHYVAGRVPFYILATVVVLYGGIPRSTTAPVHEQPGSSSLIMHAGKGLINHYQWRNGSRKDMLV
jgi:hypothetical protein